MLRRAASIARWSLAILGFACLLWLPVSFFVDGRIYFRDHLVYVQAGYLSLVRSLGIGQRFPLLAPPGTPGVSDTIPFDESYPYLQIKWTEPGWYQPAFKLLPSLERRSNALDVTLPLWLLAALCLAWPVTSLLLARRRWKGRGFEIRMRAEG